MTSSSVLDRALVLVPDQVPRWPFVVASIGLIYAAYQCHKLPKPVARVVGRLAFYPTMPFTYWSRRDQYYVLVDSHLMLGAAPMAICGHVSQLYARGVRAVINMCDEYSGPVAQYRKLGIQQLCLPTVDHTEPSLDDIKAAMEFIEDKASSGVRTYVHCKSGNGRAAAIAFCWLLYNRKMGLKETQEYLSSKRRVRKTLYMQPVIQSFYRHLHAK